MKRFNLHAFCVMMAVSICATTISGHTGEGQTVGLVLSGGGAKGIAHIGVIQALEENNIPIDYITGTSMGAIVGGLYAAGYTPDEMLALILSKEFSYWSTGKIDPSLEYYFTTEESTPTMFSMPIVLKGDSAAVDSAAVPASLISPLPMSFAFMKLFAPYTAQCAGDFNNLFVPFRCCASDVAAHRRVVLSEGDYGDAIRSSMSFPIVFQPTRFRDMLLYDGGIYDNFPVDVMKADFAPDIIIGSDVSTVEEGPQTSLIDQIENLVVQGGSYYLAPDEGIKIRFDLNRFSLLDFQQARAIYKIGYDKTMAMMDSIKGRVHARVPRLSRDQSRIAFKSQTPYLRFDTVNVTGTNEAHTRYIEYMFRKHADSDTLGIAQATQAYYQAISTGKLNDLQPHAFYNDTTGLFALDMKASVKSDLKVGIGGYVTSSSSSYVYLSGGYSTLSFNSISARMGVWLGQSYLAGQLSARMMLPTRLTSALDFQAVASRTNYFHSDRMFFTTDNPAFVHSYEYYGRLKWAFASGRHSLVDIGVGAAHLYNSFYAPVVRGDATPFRDHCHFNLGQALAKYEYNTLNDINYPTVGAFYSITGMAVTGSYRQKSPEAAREGSRHLGWLQLESVTRNYMPVSRHFALGLETDIMLSTRKLLPGYNESVVFAPAFNPTPSCYNEFDPSFRANQFVALGVVPVWLVNDNLSARIYGSCFMPVRRIMAIADGAACYARRWFDRPEAFTELNVSYRLPFATLSAYLNYATTAADKWNVGISFGVFMHAPEFLR